MDITLNNRHPNRVNQLLRKLKDIFNVSCKEKQDKNREINLLKIYNKMEAGLKDTCLLFFLVLDIETLRPLYFKLAVACDLL